MTVPDTAALAGRSDAAPSCCACAADAASPAPLDLKRASQFDESPPVRHIAAATSATTTAATAHSHGRPRDAPPAGSTPCRAADRCRPTRASTDRPPARLFRGAAPARTAPDRRRASLRNCARGRAQTSCPATDSYRPPRAPEASAPRPSAARRRRRPTTPSSVATPRAARPPPRPTPCLHRLSPVSRLRSSLGSLTAAVRSSSSSRRFFLPARPRRLRPGSQHHRCHTLRGAARRPRSLYAYFPVSPATPVKPPGPR